MIHFLGVLLLSLSIGAVGFVLSENLVRRYKVFDMLCRFSASAADEMRCRNKNLFEILRSHGNGELAFLKNIDKEMLLDKNTLKKHIVNFRVNSCDADVIADFLTGLGVGDINSQKDFCDYYGEKFDEIKKDSKKQIADKGKLQKSLFLFAGAAVFIIFI